MRMKQCQAVGAVIIALLSLLRAATCAPPASAASPMLPISSVTPGAINLQVTQANIQSTICVSGYTTTIRPSSGYTTSLKRKQLASTYSIYHDSKTGDFEEDHLISLEIGGNPTSPLNLWPEPYAGAAGAKSKDRVENKLHDLVCRGIISLDSAQKQMASNWYGSYQQYVLNESSQVTPTPIPTLQQGTPSPMISPTPSGSPLAILGTTNPLPSQIRPFGATGKCNDGTYSFARSHRGMCSGHSGVETFYI